MRSELQAATNALALVAEAAEAGGVAVRHLLPPPPSSLAGPRSPRSPKSKAKQDEDDEEELFVPEKRPLTKKQLRAQQAQQAQPEEVEEAEAEADDVTELEVLCPEGVTAGEILVIADGDGEEHEVSRVRALPCARDRLTYGAGVCRLRFRRAWRRVTPSPSASHPRRRLRS